MKSYIKLYGPSLDRGLEALDSMVKNLGKGYPLGDEILQILSIVDPSLDLKTNQLVGGGLELLGDYDFVIEWKQSPNMAQVRALMRKVDDSILYSGCRYTITTK